MNRTIYWMHAASVSWLVCVCVLVLLNPQLQFGLKHIQAKRNASPTYFRYMKDVVRFSCWSVLRATAHTLACAYPPVPQSHTHDRVLFEYMRKSAMKLSNLNCMFDVPKMWPCIELCWLVCEALFSLLLLLCNTNMIVVQCARMAIYNILLYIYCVH